MSLARRARRARSRGRGPAKACGRAIALGLALSAREAKADVFVVTHGDDAGTGSLRQAIADANASDGPDVVVFAGFGQCEPGGALASLDAGLCAGGGPSFDAELAIGTGAPEGALAITLTSGDIAIEDDVTILGPGKGALVIDASANADRIFTIESPLLEIDVADLAFHGGSADKGGAILTHSDLALVDCVFTGNTSLASDGGALNVQDGYTSAERCVFEDNSAGSDGGAVIVYSAFSALDSVFEGNRATFDGGAIVVFGAKGGSVAIVESRISGNEAGSSGGGVYAYQGDLAIVRSAIVGNDAADVGGGLGAYSSIASVLGSTVSGNTAAENGAGIVASGGTRVHVEACTVADNALADTGGAAGAGTSGASLVRITSSIVSGNTVPGADAGAASVDVGTGIGGGVIRLERSIVGVLSGTIDLPADPAESARVLVGVDPALATLAWNGGPTPTHALLPGSPAMDTGSNGAGERFDQRGPGFARVSNGAPDMGAFEVQVALPDAGTHGGGNLPPPEDGGGCGCAAAGTPSRPRGVFAGVLAAVGALVARRRRR